MRNFSLSIQLTHEFTWQDVGFDKELQWKNTSSLYLQNKFENNDNIYYVAGRFYSFRNPELFRDWINSFSGESIERWIKKADGDFSIIIINKKESKVYLFSDRNGSKRVYFSHKNGKIIISNSLIELIKLSDSPKISSFATYQLLLSYYVIDPYSLVDQTYVTMPGQIIDFDEKGFNINRYYSPIKYNVDYFTSEDECIQNVETSFRDVFSKRFEKSHTPYVMLSGGIDSVTILKYLCDIAPGKIDTITFSVQGQKVNELGPANRAAKYFGTNHHEYVIDPREGARLYVKSFLEATGWLNSSLIGLSVREYLETTGNSIDIYRGEDTRLHTPFLDTPMILGIKLFEYPKTSVTRQLARLLSKVLRLWQFYPKNYLRYLANHLDPKMRFELFILENFLKYKIPCNHQYEESKFFNDILSALPKIIQSDNIQTLYKKISECMYLAQLTDNMTHGESCMSGERTELHFPYYDWQCVEVLNRIPFGIANKPLFTLHSGSKFFMVRKRILRRLIGDSIPKKILFRKKAVADSLEAFFSSSLSHLIDFILEHWLNDLLNSVEISVKTLIETYVFEYRKKKKVDKSQINDQKLYFTIMAICHVAMLNQICMDNTFVLTNELERFLSDSNIG